MVIGSTVLALGALEVQLARTVAGHRVLWEAGMLVGGVLVTALGAALHIA